MNVQELIREIKQLPSAEKLLLLEALSHDIYVSLRIADHTKIPVDEIRGILASTGDLLSDEELKDAYLNHLMEKYT